MPHTDEMNIPGFNIRTLRQQMNISLRALAEELGMDRGGLSRLERGEQGYSHELIERIAKILSVHVSVLFSTPEVVEAAAFPARRVPLLTPEQLLTWRGPDDLEEGTETLYGSLQRMSRFAFALRVPPEPWPRYRAGDELIFDMKGNPKKGDVVAAQAPSGAVYVGRLRPLDSGAEFEVWTAGAFDPIAATNSIHGLSIRGVLVEERRIVRTENQQR